MISIFSNSLQRFKISRWFWAVLACAALLIFLLPEIASAQDLSSALNDSKTREALIQLQTWLNIGLSALNMVLWPVILMIGGLMDNELIFGGQMGETLREIWVNMRNLVNVIFVLILIVIAIYNVLGLGEKGGPLGVLQLKQIFPKFVVALIAVNFSFLGAKVLLDFTNVLTRAVLALPVNISDTGKIRQELGVSLCQGDGVRLNKAVCDQTKPGELSQKAIKFFESDNSNIALVMAVAFGKLPQQNLTKVGIEGLLQLGFNLIYGIVLFFIYGVAFIILFAVLLVRIPVLWVLVALSPLGAVSLVLPQLAQAAGGEGGFGQKFIKHATAPLIIGLFMSIGYIMIGALRNEPGIGGGYFATLKLEDIDPNALLTGIDDLHEMLISIAVAAVVWTGAGIAAKGTVAEKFSDGLRGVVAGLGKWAATLPQYAPIIPTREGGPKVSLAGLMLDTRAIQRKIEDSGKEHRLFKEGGGYSGIQKVEDKAGLINYLKQNPGIVKHEPDTLIEALEKVGYSQAAKALRENKDKPLEQRVDALFHADSDLATALGGKPKDFARIADQAERPPERTLETNKGIPRTEIAPPGPLAYSQEQERLRAAIAENTQAFRNALGPSAAAVTEPDLNQLRNAFLGLDPRVREAFTFFGSEESFDVEQAKRYADAALELQTSFTADGHPPNTTQLDKLPVPLLEAFVQALGGVDATRNKQLQTFLQQQKNK